MTPVGRGAVRVHPDVTSTRRVRSYPGVTPRPLLRRLCSSTASSTNSPTSTPPRRREWLDSLDAVIDVGGPCPRPLPARPAHGAGARAGRRRAGDGHDRLHQHDPARAGAVVPRRRGHRAPHPRVHPLERGGDGRPRRTTASTASAVTSRRTRRRPRSTRSASTTSSAARATAASATRSSSRATPRPASTPARSSRAASPRSSSTASGARSTAAGCRPTRTRGACPTFWEFPTVSMGLGPLNAVVPGALQPLPAAPRARRHERGQGVVLRRRRRDGRARGDGRARRSRAREQLDNLIFVVNCNLQRLDGPVRGNGKVIQELEAIFRGAGWNVIKVIWGAGGTSCSRATSTACSSTR